MTPTPTRGSILIVEDEQNARKGLGKLLIHEGFSILTAADGVEAMSRLAQELPDVIVTDLRMPKMDGLELIRRVKATGADLPVIVVTAAGTMRGAVEAMREGAEDYLQKPVQLEALVLALEEALRRRKTREEQRAKPRS